MPHLPFVSSPVIHLVETTAYSPSARMRLTNKDKILTPAPATEKRFDPELAVIGQLYEPK